MQQLCTASLTTPEYTRRYTAFKTSGSGLATSTGGSRWRRLWTAPQRKAVKVRDGGGPSLVPVSLRPSRPALRHPVRVRLAGVCLRASYGAPAGSPSRPFFPSIVVMSCSFVLPNQRTSSRGRRASTSSSTAPISAPSPTSSRRAPPPPRFRRVAHGASVARPPPHRSRPRRAPEQHHRRAASSAASPAWAAPSARAPISPRGRSTATPSRARPRAAPSGPRRPPTTGTGTRAATGKSRAATATTCSRRRRSSGRRSTSRTVRMSAPSSALPTREASVRDSHSRACPPRCVGGAQATW